MAQIITMPALSPTMEEGKIANWLKSEGDTVEAGDVIAEIETDKATMELESIDDGILAKILVPAGSENVKINAAIAYLLEEDDDEGALEELEKEGLASSDKVVVAAKEEVVSDMVEALHKVSDVKGEGGRVFASPLARRIAKDKGILLSEVSGSGPKGRIIKVDIENYKPVARGVSDSVGAASIDARALADMLGMKYELQVADNVRRTIAARLTEAKQTVPHFYLTIEVALDGLLSLRKELNAALEKDGAKISVNDFIIKSVAMGLEAVPAANASWAGDSILLYDKADISVAVATEHGLITPIVKDAAGKKLTEISAEVKDLATRARDKKLRPEEFQGGTFTVSNLGMFGIKEFSAIINPPQGCILAVGMGEKRAVVMDDGVVGVATMMSCTLSCDHRVVDGAVGAAFLAAFKEAMEQPARMILKGV